jgi:hypothetical protein
VSSALPSPGSVARSEATRATDPVEDELARLSEAYQGWHIWRSQAGRWWATRLGRDTHWGADSGTDYAMTIDADTLAELARELAFQVS